MLTVLLLSLTLAAPEFSVSGKVVGPDGKPLAKVSVSPVELHPPGTLEPENRGWGRGGNTNAKGEFTFKLPAGNYALVASTKAPKGSPLPALRGILKVTVSGPSSGVTLQLSPARSQNYSVTTEGELEPELVADKRLAGRVVSSKGQPLPQGIEVLVVCIGAVPEEPSVDCGGSWGAPLSPKGRRTTTDAAGRFSVEGIPRAKYAVLVDHAGEKAEHPLELHDSVADLEVKLAAPRAGDAGGP
jgi:Carboxypeptidase regulatory-like domain